LTTLEADDRRIIQFGAHHNHYASWIFNGAIGELRGVFGITSPQSPLRTAWTSRAISPLFFILPAAS